MNRSSGWRTSRLLARALQLGLATALLAGVVLVPTAPARTVPDLSGVWLVSGSEGSYALVASADRRTLTANWRGVGPHSGLVGSFQGTLNADGTTYTGTLHVTEGGTIVTGTMTWYMDLVYARFGYPRLDVSYQSDNGTSGSFELDIFLLPARVSPSAKPAVEDEFDCPSMNYCTGRDYGTPGGSAMAPFRPAARAAAATIVGSSKFSVAPGKSKRIGFALNKTGLKLLAKNGTLRVRVRISLNKSSGLPATTNLGVVTFHKH
jgi:hypothetical protein